jgi:rhamnogalacturonyl hydrolase YesR
MKHAVIVLLIVLVTIYGARSQTVDYLNNWPKDASPQVIGKLLSDRFISGTHFNYGKSIPATIIYYPEVCTWYGALTFASLSGDKKMQSQLAERFEPFFNKEANLVPIPNHVDFSVFGAIPFELYIQTKNARYLNMGKNFAGKQWDIPEGMSLDKELQAWYEKGLSWQTRFWIDDMFMISALQVQAYRATGDATYINRAAKEMVVYLDKLQQPNGLFYHAPDVPFFWGRGNGWMAAGMCELLRSLPENNAYRARIMQSYRAMMAALLAFQHENGMWLQLIDDSGSWPETSGSSMFTYSMITGVKKGWLDKKTYGPAARKAWLSLVSYIDSNGDVRDVCEGTDKKNDRQHYLDRKRITGDLHGQAPVLWCVSALLR